MPPAFRATRWTLVARASGSDPQSRAALSELCEIYYEPVLRFIEVRTRDPDTARDLAHTFFEDLLSRETIGSPDPSRGRFRNYLLGAVKHFLARQHQASLALKRGGDLEAAPLDDQIAGSTNEDLHFDREWAFALIRRAHDALEQEMLAAGKETQFRVLRPFLDGGPLGSREEACRELGLEANALNVSIYRLRERFRSIVRAEVEATLTDPSELRSEFLHLVDLIARHL